MDEVSIIIRKGHHGDLPVLRNMLYEAVYWRGIERPELEKGLARPEISKLLADWGRVGDVAVIAQEHCTPLGAAWYRFWDDENHSYGYVANDVPELAIGVLEQARGRGIGRLLIERLLNEARRSGITRVSLSVERDNPALLLYEVIGFQVVGFVGNAYTMVANTFEPSTDKEHLWENESKRLSRH